MPNRGKARYQQRTTKKARRDKWESAFLIFAAAHVIGFWFMNVNLLPHKLDDPGNQDDNNSESRVGNTNKQVVDQPGDESSSTLSEVVPTKKKPQEKTLIEYPVRFLGNAGLGHRLGRQSCAYHMAKGLNLKSIIVDWGQCEKKGESVDIWQYLFGKDTLPVKPETPASPPIFPFLERVSLMPGSTNSSSLPYHEVRLLGDVPGYIPLFSSNSRYDEKLNSKIESDYEMYQTMVGSFQFYDEIVSFRERYRLSQYTVIGLHVRAGNGERGDFKKKNRGIPNIDAWIRSVAKLLAELTQSDPRFLGRGDEDGAAMGGISRKPPLVILATETQSLIPALTAELVNYSIPVKTFEQVRIQRRGVASMVGYQNVSLCLDTWKSQVSDVILLAESDIVVTGTYSSYSQSMPLSFKLRKPTWEADGASGLRLGEFCEVGKDALRLDCYDTYADWLGHSSPLPMYGDNQAEKQWTRKEVLFLDSKGRYIPGVLETTFKDTGLVFEYTAP